MFNTHPPPVLAIFDPLPLPFLCKRHTVFQIRPNAKQALNCPLSPRSDKYPNTTPDELLALVDQVRGHLTVTHELLEAKKVQAASPQTAERASLLPAASAPSE